MKRHPLDIVIVICLIIIIILLVILMWPISSNVTEKDSKKSNKKQEVADIKNSTLEKSRDDADDNTSQSLFTDLAVARNEDEVVSYIDEIEKEVVSLSSSSDSSNTVKETLEDTFITLTDFIFYGGQIKGVTFQELTDSAKEKVLTLYEKIDRTIEQKFPNYKESIKSTSKKAYTTVVTKAGELKNSIISKYKEKVGEDAYNNVVDSFNEDKNRFQDAYTPYIEKGKEIGSQAIDKGKEVIHGAVGKLDSWYQGFKESRE